MNDNVDETALVAVVELGTVNTEGWLEVGTVNIEDLISVETVNSETTMKVETVSEPPAVSMETQSSDSDDSEEDEEEIEEEENFDYESEYADSRRRYGPDGYDYYDFDPKDFVCKKCKADDSYDYVTIRPEILTDVPSLTQIASVCVAATLWNHVNIPKRLSTVSEKCAKTSVEWKSLRKEVLSLPRRLPIPKLIAKRIKGHVRDMAPKITDWVSYHFRTIYQKNGLDKVVYNHIYHIVWRSNGSIDCEETARSLIMSVRLSEVEKFKFLATYCLRDEIEELSPLLFLNNAIEYVDALNYPLIDYWYRHFRNHFHKKGVTMDACNMFRNGKVDNWPAKEYFFDRLNEHEQVREAISLINSQGTGSAYQTAILLKLDKTQRSCIFVEQGVKILINYIAPHFSPKLVLSAWLEISHLVTADKCILIYRLLLEADVDEMLLTEMWLNTPDELKNFLVYAYNYEIIEKILLRWKWRNESDFIFLILEELHVDTRRGIVQEKFFQDFVGNLLWSGECERLEQMLEFCLPEVEEIVQFKRDVSMKANFSSHCESLLARSEYHKLDQVLEFCFFGLEEKLRFKTDFIKTTSCVNRCENLLTFGDYQRLNCLIEFLQPNVQERFRFKKELFAKTSCMVHCEKLLWHGDYGKLDEVMNFCMLELEEKVRFKKDLIKTTSSINHCDSLLMWGDFVKLNGVLDFCLPESEEKLQFKIHLIKTSSCAARCESLFITGDFTRLSHVLEFLLPDVEERTRFIEKLFRKQSCVNSLEQMILCDEYTKLDKVLEFCLPKFEEKVRFKTDFIKTPFCVKNCEKLLTMNNYQKLDRMLSYFLPEVPERTKFKNELFKSSSCTNHCKGLLLRGEYQKLDRILDYCLLEVEKVRYKVANKSFFMDYCKNLLLKHDHEKLNFILEIGFPKLEEKVRFARDMAKEAFFVNYCDGLLSIGDYMKLNQSLKLCFLTSEETVQFTTNLVINSKHIRNTCLDLYSSGDAVQLNNYLAQFLKRDLILPYKVNLLKSPDGVKKCIDLLESPTDVSSSIIADTLTDANQAIAFKKSLIMSSDSISKLKKLLTNNGLNVVINCYNRYLTSVEDKNVFKKLLVGDVVKQMRIIMQNSDTTYLQSFMLWYFSNEEAVERYKKSMPLDFIFIDLLKETIFTKYDRLLTNCRFRTCLDFTIVNRFLNWYFKSPVDKLQYKMKIIHNYNKFELFNTLLRKSDERYLQALVQWFFQKDSVEIAKYKSMSRCNKIIARLI